VILYWVSWVGSDSPAGLLPLSSPAEGLQKTKKAGSLLSK